MTALLASENKEKININIRDNTGKNPLDIAVLMGKTDIALQLLERGATTFVSQKPSGIATSIFESKMEPQNVSGYKNSSPKPII